LGNAQVGKRRRAQRNGNGIDMDAIEKALGLLNDLSDWIDDEREQADAMIGKLGQSDVMCSRSYVLKDVGQKVDAIKTQIAKMIITPPPPPG
jgi:hypothetical protein